MMTREENKEALKGIISNLEKMDLNLSDNKEEKKAFRKMKDSIYSFRQIYTE
jgi:hypothetical protein